MITQYIILSGGSAAELTTLVQDKITAGWQPYKDPFAYAPPAGHVTFYQAMSRSDVTFSATASATL